PDQITVDVSGLDIAATLTLAELEPPSGVVFVDENPEEVTIATVVVPTEVEEPEEVEEETELVGEEGEGVEAAEGGGGEGGLAAERWGLPRAKKKYAGLFTDGRTGPGGPRVGVLLPQTFMNDAGGSASPARGDLRVPLERVVAVHDEIDLPFGEVQVRLGGGL